MFNKEQLTIINKLLIAKYESLGEMLIKKSRQLGPHPGEAITAITLARTQIEEMLGIIEPHLEEAFAQEQTPSRQEIIDTIKEAIYGSIPHIAKSNTFMITPESWAKLAAIVDPDLENVFKAILKAAKWNGTTNQNIENVFKTIGKIATSGTQNETNQNTSQ